MDHSGHGMDGMNMDLPPFTLGRGLEFGGDPVFLVGCLLGLGLYGWAVIRLRRRGTPGRWAGPSPGPWAWCRWPW